MEQIKALQLKLKTAEQAFAGHQARIIVLESTVTELQIASAAVSHEVRVARNAGPAGQLAVPAAPSRGGAPGRAVIAARAAPASAPVLASSAAKVVVASTCPAVTTKLEALEHAKHAVCLVGALNADCVVSAQLVAGGKDLLLAGQAKPSFADVARGVSRPEQAQPAEAVGAQPKRLFLVEVVLANSHAASMVLRDAYKLAGVNGMEHTFVRRSLTPQLLKQKRRLIAAYAAELQAARVAPDTRVRFKDDVVPCIQRRNAEGQWRTVRVFKELPTDTAPASTGEGTEAGKTAT